LFGPRSDPKIVAIMLASKSRSFRHRVGCFQLSRFFSGCYTFRGAFRFSSSDDLKLLLPGESHKLCKPDLSTFGRFAGGQVWISLRSALRLRRNAAVGRGSAAVQQEFPEITGRASPAA
jgi:hypothetical protein